MDKKAEQNVDQDDAEQNDAEQDNAGQDNVGQNREVSQDLSIEDAFAQIRSLLQDMEREDATLEESFANYEKGMKLIQYCNAKIDKVEKKVQKLNEDGTLEDFE